MLAGIKIFKFFVSGHLKYRYTSTAPLFYEFKVLNCMILHDIHSLKLLCFVLETRISSSLLMYETTKLVPTPRQCSFQL